MGQVTDKTDIKSILPPVSSSQHLAHDRFFSSVLFVERNLSIFLLQSITQNHFVGPEEGNGGTGSWVTFFSQVYLKVIHLKRGYLSEKNRNYYKVKYAFSNGS